MRSKTYWDKDQGASDPFEIPKRVARGIEACSTRGGGEAAISHPLRYIWIYVTEAGLRQDGSGFESEATLGLEGWLNVIDESAALGAEWMVVYVGASLSEVPYIWQVCAWAQDVHNLRAWLNVNGEKRQDGNTGNLIFNVPFLVSYLSQFMSLLPGDVISTGTPAGVGAAFDPPRFLKPGDTVELGIDGLGSSTQHVTAYG